VSTLVPSVTRSVRAATYDNQTSALGA